MKIPKLFQHLEYFNKDDFKSFERFLKTPFLNRHLKSYTDIFRIISKNKNLLAMRKYEELRKTIMEGSGCSEKTTLTTISGLGDLVIEYFKMKAMDVKNYEKEYALCEYLISTGYYDILDERIEVCLNILLNGDNLDESIYLNYYQIDYLNYRSSVLQDSKILGDKSIIEQQSHTLNASRNIFIYTLTKLVIGYINYTIQNIDTTYKNPDSYPVVLDSMFDITEKPEFQTYDLRKKSIIKLYRHLYLMFSNLGDDDYYNNYKKYFYEIRDIFKGDFSKTHFNILLNYCHLRNRLNDKGTKFNTEGLRVLSEYIENKMYINDNNKYLSPLLYRNFVVGCNIPKTKNILKRLIENETINLHTSHRRDMKNFGSAYYYYLNKEYGKAIKCIIELNHPKFMYKYDIRNLELKIYFEKKNYIELKNVLHNYHENIKSEPLFTRIDKDKYKIMIDYFNDLIRADEKYSMTHDILPFEYLLNQIKSDAGFVMKQWFTHKVESIIEAHYIKYGLKKQN